MDATELKNRLKQQLTERITDFEDRIAKDRKTIIHTTRRLKIWQRFVDDWRDQLEKLH